MSDYILQKAMDTIIYPCRDLRCAELATKTPAASVFTVKPAVSMPFMMANKYVIISVLFDQCATLSCTMIQVLVPLDSLSI